MTPAGHQLEQGDSVGRRSSVLRVTLLAIAVVMVVAATVLVVRPDLRGWVSYRLADHTGSPPSLGQASPPANGDAPPTRLAVAGDVGTGADEVYRTAGAMDRVEATIDYDALLLLGDNVYPDGDPDQVRRTVFDPFADVLDGSTRLLPVLGNHDVRNGNGVEQAAALGMPGRWYATDLGDTLVVALDSTRPDDPAQVEWLADTLASSTATWKIAILHHPPYSGGYHGSSLDVRDAFSPLFERYGVQLVLAGHDHDYQRSDPINGVTYVVSGAVAKLRDARLADFSAVAWSAHHFVDIGVWSDRMELRAIDQSGTVIDTATLIAVPASGRQ